jgi:predicted ribosome-associated RNA-binding protein Tma20
MNQQRQEVEKAQAKKLAEKLADEMKQKNLKVKKEVSIESDVWFIAAISNSFIFYRNSRTLIPNGSWRSSWSSLNRRKRISRTR